MIQIIGLIIGTYVFTRMVELFNAKETGTFTSVLALLTAVVAVLGTIGLFLSGTSGIR